MTGRRLVRVLAGLSATVTLGGCGQAGVFLQPEAEAPAQRVPLPEAAVVGVAWPQPAELVLGLSHGAPSYDWSTHRLDVTAGRLEPLALPAMPSCRRTRYGFPTALADGRVSFSRACDGERVGGPRVGDAVVAVTVDTATVSVLAELGTGYSPLGSSWNPTVERGVAARNSSLCASLFWVTPDGPEDLRLELGSGEQRWRLDEELHSRDCRGGRAAWPAWSPDGRSIAFFASPESAGVEGFSRLDRPWELMVLDPDSLATRTLVRGVEHARATSWSPDGRWIAYAAEEDGVFVVSADGGRPRRVSEEKALWLVWSPDGAQLALAGPDPARPPTDLVHQLLVLDVGGLER